jgi:hypothetical protein
MTWGVFYRPPQCPDWEDSQGGVRDGPSLSFVKEYSPYSPATVPPPQPHRQPRHLLISPRHAHPPPPPIRNPTTPQFKNPLSDLILNDPAFSSDPRSHPHFPLTNARSYKDPPSKSSQSYSRHVTQARHVSLSHEAPHSQENAPIKEVLPRISHRPLPQERRSSPFSAYVESASITTHSTFTPSTASPTTSHSHSLTQTPGSRTPSVASTSHLTANSTPSSQPQFKHEPNLPVSQVPNNPSMLFNTSAPEMPLKAQKPSVLPRTESAPILSENKKSTVGKRGMKSLFRRLTNRRGLDRIDELDETDPFGGSYHHGGPYEAIGNSLAELGPPRMYDDFDVLRGDPHNPKCEVGIANAHAYAPGLMTPVKTATHPARRVKHKVCIVVFSVDHHVFTLTERSPLPECHLLQEVKMDCPCTSNPAKSSNEPQYTRSPSIIVRHG